RPTRNPATELAAAKHVASFESSGVSRRLRENALPPRLLGGWRRLRRWRHRRRRRRRTVEWHPVDDPQHRDPHFAVLLVRVAVAFEDHDRHDFLFVLAAVEPVAYRLDQSGDGFDAAVGCRLEDHLDAGISASGAFQLYAPLICPRKAVVWKRGDIGLRLGDGNEALAEHLLVVIPADGAPPGRQDVDGPAAALLGDGSLLSICPGVFPAFE